MKPLAKSVVKFGLVVGVLCALVYALDCYDTYLMTGRLWRRNIIERLDHPVALKGWDESGLILADGRKVMPTGMKSLPKDFPGMKALTMRGVEIQPDGRVFGLLDAWHWCGNDPVRKEYRRVDIAMVLTFVEQGESLIPVAKDDYRAISSDMRMMSETRWDSFSMHRFLKFARGEKDPHWRDNEEMRQLIRDKEAANAGLR